MDNRGLLFIPDISGFSEFVNATEIEHSRLIIQELLEVLINANKIHLEVSEIEGDAILFFKFGEAPSIAELYEQVASMFCDFHRHLVAYEYRRFCQCDACRSAIGLTLKVITHHGEFTGYTIKNFNKLIGKDLIVAHRLLKNDIAQHEYWLVTSELIDEIDIKKLPQWLQWRNSAQQTESGLVDYSYAGLSELKNQIPPESLPQVILSEKQKEVSVEKIFNTDIIRLFHGSGDFTYRGRWQEGVKAVEELNHLLPRIGMRCKYLLEDGEQRIFASSYSFHPDRIEFSETEEKKNITTCYTLTKIDDNRTKLEIDYFIPKSFPQNLLFKYFHKKKVEQRLKKSLINLERLIPDIRLPGE